jgi:hypothetical protein
VAGHIPPVSADLLAGRSGFVAVSLTASLTEPARLRRNHKEGSRAGAVGIVNHEEREGTTRKRKPLRTRVEGLVRATS